MSENGFSDAHNVPVWEEKVSKVVSSGDHTFSIGSLIIVQDENNREIENFHV